ncbi:MAG: ATP-binding cassette domain-containing protein [Candidatus Nitrohelix vancouverensis]|uniref:ATP-binding cassette domain-containing protein n=1 Tax=Candidatus Nitrohelix vancouverensis TaxID=2705534 RepID=A0A7T0G376_9BACT|nr:MAG: ATP-binding cassette domain-containing protein [Candidatus Nitrohelix vancouverensis]
MIEIENLTKYYGPRRAINNLSFRVERDEVVGFLGPNGAGKSTTMNILTGIFPASSGSARICGHDIVEESMAVRKLIGYLPENPPLYQDMTVTRYLEFAARLRQVPGKNIRASVERALSKCSLNSVSGRIIGRLSKGFQQRVGLAQALIHDPDILILDEPTIGLDPIQIIEIRKLIQELAASHTIILSSHILPEITQICKRVIILNEGEIAAVDSLEGLTSSLRKSERLFLKVRKHFTEEMIESLKRLPGALALLQDGSNELRLDCELNSDLQDAIARFCLDHSLGIVELRAESMSLEDIFLKLTLEEKEAAQ